MYEIPFALNYELDLFGRYRKNLQAANANSARAPRPTCKTFNWS